MSHVDSQRPRANVAGLNALRTVLLAVDGRGYGDYKRIKGSYDLGRFRLVIDYVQGDPFATPSRFRAQVPPTEAGLPRWFVERSIRRTAVADYLNRTLAAALDGRSRPLGSGQSGVLEMLPPGQEVLRRTSLIVNPDGGVEARFRVGLPARGRRVLGRAAADLLCSEVPDAILTTLPFDVIDEQALRQHVEVVENAVHLRAQLTARGLVAFVADGARLARRSGVDDRPRESTASVPFESPADLRVTLDVPHGDAVTGMGIPRGVTLIVGGGYHGKTTLLRAIERGVYDHVPGDGRERVVTIPEAVKVRAEDGRSIAGTDISNFIGHLPGGDTARRFATENASGSTSQAAAIVEALEVGARCLLLDEDTSATNFMIRDARMQALVEDRDEPITPFIDRTADLAHQLEVSTIVVIGGSGDYFDVADTVITMREFRPQLVTNRAKRIAREHPTGRRSRGGGWRPPRVRVPHPDMFNARHRRRDANIKVLRRDRVLFGGDEIDLAALEQLVEAAQTRAIAHAVHTAREEARHAESMANVFSWIMARLHRDGLDGFTSDPLGELAEFRVFELAAFVNRRRRAATPAASDDSRQTD